MSIFYPVKLLADWLTYNVFNIAPQTLLADAVNFFIYDTIKIFILLAVIIFCVSIVRSYLPPEKIRAILSHKSKYTGNVIASLLGIITPVLFLFRYSIVFGFYSSRRSTGNHFFFSSGFTNDKRSGFSFTSRNVWLENCSYVYHKRTYHFYSFRNSYR